MLKISKVTVVGWLVLGLAGCSAHPGSGSWGQVSPSDAPISKVLVHFEGRAELVDASTGQATHHCFWGGKNASELQLDCTTAADTETRLHYRFKVESETQAVLMREGQVIGRYQRMPAEG